MNTYFSFRNALNIFIILIISFSVDSYATPPEYLSFHREQAKNPPVNEDELIRIWMIYVGQGDSILIQIPGVLVGQVEPYDVLVDSGAYNKPDYTLANKFLSNLYDSPTTIENIVISHHDNDHVAGLTSILSNENLTIENIWHNGLASYDPEAMGLSGDQLLNSVSVKNNNVYERVMGELGADHETIKPIYLVKSLQDLKTKKNAGKLQGVYDNLANSVLQKYPKVKSFTPANYGSDFIKVENDEILFEPIWPLESRKEFGDWGQTINGNSLSFRFTYKDFQMLFTGDLNEQSEPVLLEHLKKENKLSLLECDVLKVPHHGSKHSVKEFFQDEHMKPVIGVASMGKQGFQTNWKHPSTDIIEYMGGAHRFYSTYVHERKFDYSDFATNDDQEKMIEKTNILIETDGHWFRIVEIPIENPIENIPTVQSVKRGNGTLWIKATP